MMSRGLVLAIAICAALAWGNVATAQNGDISAAVHSGACNELGDEVASLNTPQPEGGDWVGVEGLGVVLQSETDDVVSGQDLIDSPHSVVIFAGGTVVACGEVGGPLDDEDLYIGLQPVDNSGYFGIAELDDLDDDDDEVEIDLYVFQPAN
jgi:hypothetical protein